MRRISSYQSAAATDRGCAIRSVAQHGKRSLATVFGLTKGAGSICARENADRGPPRRNRAATQTRRFSFHSHRPRASFSSAPALQSCACRAKPTTCAKRPARGAECTGDVPGRASSRTKPTAVTAGERRSDVLEKGPARRKKRPVSMTPRGQPQFQRARVNSRTAMDRHSECGVTNVYIGRPPRSLRTRGKGGPTPGRDAPQPPKRGSQSRNRATEPGTATHRADTAGTLKGGGAVGRPANATPSRQNVWATATPANRAARAAPPPSHAAA